MRGFEATAGALRGLLPLAAILAVAFPRVVDAHVAPQAYANVGVFVPDGATVPLDAIVTDEGGQRRALRTLISKPTVLIFTDYTCTTLCGPIIAFVASALEKSGLQPGQFALVAIGIDPKDTAADAVTMRREHLGDDGAIDSASVFVRADAPVIQQLTNALGYRYAYDEEHDQFVHPGAAYVLRPDGRVSRVLTGLGLSAGDMRLALVEAGEGHVGTFSDQIRLLCSGFDPIQGAYNVAVSRVLAATGFATMLGVGGLIGVLFLMGRRRPT
jgi:protein SCO1/2